MLCLVHTTVTIQNLSYFGASGLNVAKTDSRFFDVPRDVRTNLGGTLNHQLLA